MKSFISWLLISYYPGMDAYNNLSHGSEYASFMQKLEEKKSYRLRTLMVRNWRTWKSLKSWITGNFWGGMANFGSSPVSTRNGRGTKVCQVALEIE